MRPPALDRTIVNMQLPPIDVAALEQVYTGRLALRMSHMLQMWPDIQRRQCVRDARFNTDTGELYVVWFPNSYTKTGAIPR